MVVISTSRLRRAILWELTTTVLITDHLRWQQGVPISFLFRYRCTNVVIAAPITPSQP